MRNKVICNCPVCNERLVIEKLKCKKCGLELSNEFYLPEFFYLSDEEKEIIETFLSAAGSIKEMQNKMGKSYPFVKKMLDNVLIKLGYKSVQDDEKEEFIMPQVQIDENSELASEIIKAKLVAEGGRATVYTLQGKPYEVSVTGDGEHFKTLALPQWDYELRVFDVIQKLLIEEGGRANKGNGRNYKLGEDGCELNTVVGRIGSEYQGKKIGESVFDPTFILAAIMEWAGISKNCRGYIELI